jgi:uncharacterized protein YdeI (YjbR/CyaY-like superfamily)
VNRILKFPAGDGRIQNRMEKINTVMAKDRKAWRSWLENNGASKKAVWLVFYKKHTGKPTVSYEEAVEEAVCFGWIDGMLRKMDNQRYAQKFTPRSEKTVWSETNVRRAEKMIREGRMTEAGLAKYRGAPVRAPLASRLGSGFPPTLLKFLKAETKAFSFFKKLAPSQQRLYIGWVASAKQDETRRRRLEEMILKLKKGEKLGMK